MTIMVKTHLCSVFQKSPPILVVKQESNFWSVSFLPVFSNQVAFSWEAIAQAEASQGAQQ